MESSRLINLYLTLKIERSSFERSQKPCYDNEASKTNLAQNNPCRNINDSVQFI
jgi:hypothetical protein